MEEDRAMICRSSGFEKMKERQEKERGSHGRVRRG